MVRCGWMHVFATLATAVIATAGAAADCAAFYDSLDSLSSIAANSGAASGVVTFGPGVNGNCASFGPNGHISYSARGFRTPAGTLSLWYKKTSTASSGGIAQIGAVSLPDSIGLFYANGSDLTLEVRGSGNQPAQVYVQGALPQGQWTHIAAAWLEQNGSCGLWLFVNGAYRGYASLPDTLSHAVATLQLGTTGFYGHGGGSADELRWFDWNLLDSEVYAEYVYSSNRYVRQASSKPTSTGPVQLSGNVLYVNGQPFKVHGVGYAPTPIGANPGYPIYTDPAILARDVPLLKAMHVNTVRTWGAPPNSMLLDALYYNGGDPIYVIVGFWVDTSGVDYGDPAVIADYENRFGNVVNQFKDHPGVLGWGIGNEVNLSNSGPALANWYILADHLAQVAYLAEGPTYHPTILVNGGLQGLGNVDYHSDDAALTSVDVWGQNTYFGWDAHCFFDYYARLSAKPLLFTEFGIDAWNNRANAEYQDVQAAWDVRQWRQIRSGCLGGTVMAYSDEWWKAGDLSTHDFGGYATGSHPDGFSNEEWWGMMAVADGGGGPDIMQPRQVYYALTQEWAHGAGDYDGDGDVDLADFAAFQSCFGAPADGLCGTAFDIVVDGVIDAADAARLLQCFNGPNQPATCGN